MTIRVLPPHVVNRIAAGEVVERPANVVKELVENALDAGARRIEVLIAGGGTQEVRVVDDGAGIPAAELPLALQSHATSKIFAAEDIFRVASLGFRGEALASIAAVSRLRLRSRPAEAAAGAEVEVEGGKVGPVRPAAAPPGTLVEVRDLFFNTPARRRFLKTERTETGYCLEWLERLALAHPDVAFEVLVGGRRRIYPPGPLAARVTQVLGEETAAALIPVAARSGAMHLSGFVLPPERDAATARGMHCFVNGRWVRDRSWLAAVREAYHGLLMRGRHPVTLLWLTLPPEQVDVNVHPTKIEVRFREPSRLYALTLQAVRQALGGRDLRPAVGGGRAAPAPPPTVRERAAPPPPVQPRSHAPFRAERPAKGAAPRPRVFQVRRTYIVVETPAGLEVTDQHALHERILFEAMRERLARGGVPVQTLLVPEAVPVGPAAARELAAAGPALERLGLRLSVSGGRVLVLGVPEPLRRTPPSVLVRALLAFQGEGGKDLLRLADPVLASLACRGAVKAGDPLDEGTMLRLLQEGERVAHSPFCPHGRPVTVRIPWAEVEQWFRRGR